MLTYEYYRQNIHEFDKYKGKDLVPFNCCRCERLYYSKQRNCRIAVKYKNFNYNYCSNDCLSKEMTTSVTVPCGQCEELVTRVLKEFKSAKSGKVFCNQSCAAKYTNTHKTTGTRRSKIECYMEEQLRLLYPNLQIITNSVDLVNFELDFYFPELKFAIELNGIVHYEPIYGQNKFERIQNNDKQKMIRCYELGIELMVLDISKQSRFTIESSQNYMEIVATQLDSIMQRKEPAQTT